MVLVGAGFGPLTLRYRVRCSIALPLYATWHSPHQPNLSPFYVRSLCSNGLYSSDYERLKKVFLQTYGFEHLVTFSLLVRSGLIVLKDSTSSVLLNTATRKVTGGGGQGASAAVPRAARPNFQSVVKKFSQQPTEAISQGFVFRHTSICFMLFLPQVSNC